MFIAMDFGTSFSQIAATNFGTPLLLHPPLDYGTPSCFYYDSKTGVLVGDDALNAGQGNQTKNLKTNFKLEIGKDFFADGRKFTSEEMVSEIYKNLLHKGTQIASKKGIRTNIEGVVLTVPVKLFGVKERELIKRAAERAIPNRCDSAIITEPVAAAIYHFHQSLNKNRNILVYDLGGGTCDIALVTAAPGNEDYFKVIDSDMITVGGKDFDQKISEYILTALKTDYHLMNCNNNIVVKEKVRRESIAAKHALSDGFRNEYIARIEVDGILREVTISLNVFKEITAGLIAKTIDCLENLYNKNSGAYRIDEIICVGGSSNMPQVKEEIEEVFPGVPCHVREPENSVVFGAAIFSNLIQGKSINAKNHLLAKTPFSYGVECLTHISNIIIKGSSLPSENTREYFARNQKGGQEIDVVYNIFESEVVDSAYKANECPCTKVGKLTVTHKSKRRSEVNMNITFTVTANGLLQFKVVDENKDTMKHEFKLESFSNQ